MQYLDAGCCPQNLRELESHRGRWTETACTGTSITISDFPTLGKSAKQMIYMVAAFLEKLGCVTPVHVGNRVQSVFH